MMDALEYMARSINSLTEERDKYKADADGLAVIVGNLIYTSSELWDQIKCIRDTDCMTVTHPVIEDARAALAAHEEGI